MNQLEIAQHQEIQKLNIEKDVMKQLASRDGFFLYYFTMLKTASTNAEAFTQTNDLYFSLFGSYRYSCIDSFKINLKRHFKK